MAKGHGGMREPFAGETRRGWGGTTPGDGVPPPTTWGRCATSHRLGTAAPHLKVSDNEHLETGQMFRSLLLLSLWPVAHLPSVVVEVYQLLSLLNQCFPNLYLASASS